MSAGFAPFFHELPKEGSLGGILQGKGAACKFHPNLEFAVQMEGAVQLCGPGLGGYQVQSFFDDVKEGPPLFAAYQVRW